MGLPVTVYRWDDDGAPQITEFKPSAYIAVLRAALVDGYGNKAGAGWMVAFEDQSSPKIAFRSSTTDGVGGYVQFWSNDGGDTSASCLLYRAAAGMSSLDSFINAGYSEVLKGTTDVSFTHWMIIATSVGFYVFFMRAAINTIYKGYYSAFIGEIDSVLDNDQGRFVGTSGQTGDRTFDSTISPNTQSIFNIDVNFKPRLYDSDGDSTSYVHTVTLLNQYIASANGADSDDITAQVPMSFYEVPIFSPVSPDRQGTNRQASKLSPLHRGYVPGLLRSFFYGYKDVLFPYIRTFDGKQYMLCPNYSDGVACNWLNIEEWY